MANKPATPLVHFQVEADGNLSLVMAKEVFEALEKAFKSQQPLTEHEGFVRVSVTTVEAKIAVPVKTDTICPPKTFFKNAK